MNGAVVMVSIVVEEGDAAEVCNSPYSFNVISNILRIGNFEHREHREHREQREQRGGAPVAASS